MVLMTFSLTKSRLLLTSLNKQWFARWCLTLCYTDYRNDRLIRHGLFETVEAVECMLTRGNGTEACL